MIQPQHSGPARVQKDMEAVAALERDAELMLRVRDGDDTSFALLLERHRRPVVHFLYRMVPNQGVSEPGIVRAHGKVHYLVVPNRDPSGSQLDKR
jgi:hypothetical protein